MKYFAIICDSRNYIVKKLNVYLQKAAVLFYISLDMEYRVIFFFC